MIANAFRKVVRWLNEGDRATISQSGYHPSNDASWLTGGGSFAGVNVTPANALQLGAVYAAVRILSESVASIPIKLYKRKNGGGADVERDHPASWVVREQPNENTTSFSWRETGQGHLCTWGNAYSEIETNNKDEIIGLWGIRPDRVEPEFVGRSLVYKIETDSAQVRLPSRKVLHIMNLGSSGYKGISPIQLQRESLGIGKAAERYAGTFFGNRMGFNGFVRHPETLTTEGREALIDGLERVHKGPSNSWRTAVLDEGMDWVSVGIPNDDAQLLETRTFQVQEVARWFRIPPHMLAELSHATFSNIEELSREFVMYCLMPWLRRWEGELNRKLLTMAERKAGLYFEFLVDGLLRGDFKTRTEGYSSAIQNGWMSPNEARAKENLNPYPGGDIYLVQQNLQAVEDVGKEPELPPAPAQEEDDDGKVLPFRFEGRESVRHLEVRAQRSLESRWKLQRVFEALLAEATGRLVTKEAGQIRRQIKRMPESGEAAFRQWLEVFFEKHQQFAAEVLAPVFRSYMDAVGSEALAEVDGDEAAFRQDLDTFHEEYSAAFGKRYAEKGQVQIEQLLTEGETEEEQIALVLERLENWEEKLAGKVALAESARAMNAVSILAYLASGVTLLRWVWNGGDCRICPNLHGKVVEIGRPFVNKGDRLDTGEGFTDMIVKTVRAHPPLHGGCLCGVTPG